MLRFIEEPYLDVSLEQKKGTVHATKRSQNYDFLSQATHHQCFFFFPSLCCLQKLRPKLTHTHTKQHTHSTTTCRVSTAPAHPPISCAHSSHPRTSSTGPTAPHNSTLVHNRSPLTPTPEATLLHTNAQEKKMTITIVTIY